VEPPPPDALALPGAIICLAGRGPFDEAAAAMLAQVLRKRGFGAVSAPAELLRGGDLTGFAVDSVRQAWLCTVESGASAAAGRYLLRRLKRRFPEAMVAALVVGAQEGRLSEALHAEGAVAVERELGAAARTALRLLPALAGTG
jgi:hypothetical protein